MAALVFLVSAVMVGCSERNAAEGRPTEPQAREAYFDTPLIRGEVARRIPLGITRRELIRELTRAAAIEVVDGNGLRCGVYPLSGTEGRDAYGSPVAAEVWFCFAENGRLQRKRWFSRHA
jgi:hypothetical protein